MVPAANQSSRIGPKTPMVQSMDSVHQPQLERSFRGSLSLTEGDLIAVMIELRLGEFLLRTDASEIGRWSPDGVAVSRKPDGVFQMLVDGEVVWFTPEDADDFEDGINRWRVSDDAMAGLAGTDFAGPGVPGHAPDSAPSPSVVDGVPAPTDGGATRTSTAPASTPPSADDADGDGGIAIGDPSPGSDVGDTGGSDSTTIEWLFEHAYDSTLPPPEVAGVEMAEPERDDIAERTHDGPSDRPDQSRVDQNRHFFLPGSSAPVSSLNEPLPPAPPVAVPAGDVGDGRDLAGWAPAGSPAGHPGGSPGGVPSDPVIDSTAPTNSDPDPADSSESEAVVPSDQTKMPPVGLPEAPVTGSVSVGPEAPVANDESVRDQTAPTSAPTDETESADDEPAEVDGLSGRYAGTSQGRLARIVAARRSKASPDAREDEATEGGADLDDPNDAMTVADQVLEAQNAMRANASNARDWGRIAKRLGIGVLALTIVGVIVLAAITVPSMFGGASAAESTDPPVPATQPAGQSDDGASTAVAAASVDAPTAGEDSPAVTSATVPTSADAPSENTEEASEAAGSDATPGVFGRPVAEFIDEWDEVARQVSPALLIPTAIVPGDFEFGFTSHLSMAGVVDRSGELGLVSLLVDPSGDAQSDALALQSLGVAITVVDATTTGADRRNILAGLGLDVAAPDLDGLDGRLTQNGVSYHLVYDAESEMLTFTLGPG